MFISGYTATIVYGRSLQQRGMLFMTLQVLRRCWQLYAAHILVFVFFIAQIAWVSVRFANGAILEELNVADFLQDPTRSLVQALTLHYRPANLDVLPLYMALMLALPLLLWLARLSLAGLLAASLTLWLCVQMFKWAWPVYEDGAVWFFNPLGWQLLFVIGVLAAIAYLAARLKADSERWAPLIKSIGFTADS